MLSDDRRQISEGRGLVIRPLALATRLRPGTLPLFILALIALAYYAFVTFAPKPLPKPDATWVRIVNEGVFRIGIDPSFPPFEADDGKGNLSGLDIALADEIVRQWSNDNATTVRVEYVYTGYDGLYDALKAGQFDAILSALPYDPKKTEDVRFSHSYFNGGPLIVVRVEDASTKSWYDLANKRVGVELGSSGDSFARRWQRRLRYDLREFNTAADALRALRSGQLDGVFTDAITFNDFARPSTGRRGEPAEPSGQAGGVRQVGDPLVNDLFVIAVRKDTPTLLQQINAVIDAMKRDGRMDKLYGEWF